MRFRDLKLFNQVMLAKIRWRIIKNPDSLLAQILKGKYFKGRDFMTAPIGLNPSLAWRSIVWGRDLFEKGFRWKVGNGRHIMIDKDPWLACDGCKISILINNNLEGKRVQEILDE